ncbi:hypothetical protein CCP2SC5_280031 [Azospirillaceae bacterium]
MRIFMWERGVVMLCHEIRIECHHLVTFVSDKRLTLESDAP